MSPRTPTLPPTDGAMWRKLLAASPPDAGGTHELFIWAGAVKDAICGGELGPKSSHPRSSPGTPTPEENPRLPYPDGAEFQAGTLEALRLSEELGPFNLYGGILALLADCEPLERYARQQERGASYRQLAAIAHACGMSKTGAGRVVRGSKEYPSGRAPRRTPARPAQKAGSMKRLAAKPRPDRPMTATGRRITATNERSS